MTVSTPWYFSDSEILCTMSVPRRPLVMIRVFLNPSLSASGPIISCAPGPIIARGKGWNSLIGKGLSSSSTCIVDPLRWPGLPGIRHRGRAGPIGPAGFGCTPPAERRPGPHRLVAVNVSGVTAATEELKPKPVAGPFGKPGTYLPERTGQLTWPVGGGRPEIAR